ncbi:MAG: chemotaxis protein CheX [Lachnospiraceae bacterium]|nr:chemotaxis protein CheX [Lachnospiraceae bacterium]
MGYMFTQFFGNYLLNNQYVTAEQLIEGIHIKSKTRLKLGVLAIDAGYMTAAQVEEVHERQMLVDKRIGDIAVEMGYLTEAQVEELLGNQKKGYLLLGQALVDKGFMTNDQFEEAISNYKSKYKIDDSVSEEASDLKAAEMVKELCDFSYEDSKMYTDYVVLLLKNLVRFVGDDFAPIKPVLEKATVKYKSVSQKVKGSFSMDMAVAFDDENSMVEFANRYSDEMFTVDEMEYIEAAACDFINIHNGLFTVNVSSESNEELTLTPPEVFEGKTDIEVEAIVFPIKFTFGEVKFIIA